MDIDTSIAPSLLSFLLSFDFNFSLPVLIDFIIITILLIVSAILAGSEVAFFSLNPSQLNSLKDHDDKRNNKIILHLINHPKRLLATLLIGNGLANIAIIIFSSLVTAELGDFSDNPVLGFVIQVVMVTFMIVLFGEVIPKVYATHNNMKVVGIMAIPIYFLDKLFSPVSIVLISTTRFIEKRMKKKKSYDITIDELTHAIDITSDTESPPEEKRILKGIVQFGNIDVKQIMKNRMEVVAIEIKTPFSEVLRIIEVAGYSRIPVFEDTLDKVKGILYIKDLIAHLDKDDSYRWQGLVREAYFVPESKKINDLLKEFQGMKMHMAVVIDEYGGSAGIATLEDVLEEIVGEMKDEFDDDEPQYSKLDDDTFVFEGKILLNDVCRVMNIDRSEFEDVTGEPDSLAGFILELNGKIPQKNEIINYRNFRFTIESSDRRKIKRVKISRLKTEELNEQSA